MSLTCLAQTGLPSTEPFNFSTSKMAGEIPYLANHNTTYSGGPDYHQFFSGLEFSPAGFPDDSFNGWDIDIDIDPTRLDASDLLSDEEKNQYGYTLPPDFDLGINEYGSSLHPNAGSGLDRLDVLDDQNSLSLLPNNTDDIMEGLEGLELSSESQNKQEMMPLDSRKQQSMDAPKGKNTRGRPTIPITSVEFYQCKGRTLVDVAKELDVSVCTLKRRLEDLTGFKKWTEFKRSKSFSQRAHGKIKDRG